MTIFNNAVKKLAFIYIAALMVVSLSASYAMYKIADKQFETGLRRQQDELINRQPLRPFLIEIDQIRLQEQSNVRANLLFGLIIFNLAVLIGGSYLSFFSARSTLRPIKYALDAQNRFTADASHELRTPLSAMKSEIEVALRDKKLTAEDARNVLISNLEEIDDLEQLTTGLLVLARVPESKIKFSKIELTKIIKSAQKQVEKSTKNRSVKIINSITTKQYVYAEETTLIRLLVILLTNAVKYSSNNSQVSLKALHQKGKIIIVVKDEGIGIKPADKDKIFDRFYRVDSSRSKNTNTKGYGLGLAIAKKIADQYDTKIHVSSVYGKGSEFSFYLTVA